MFGRERTKSSSTGSTAIKPERYPACSTLNRTAVGLSMVETAPDSSSVNADCERVVVNPEVIPFLTLSGSLVRTKPQAPRSLRCWLTSSFVAGVVCESQEVTHCDSSSQNDARRARASQLLCRHDAALSAFRRTVRTTLRQVAGPARSG